MNKKMKKVIGVLAGVMLVFGLTAQEVINAEELQKTIEKAVKEALEAVNVEVEKALLEATKELENQRVELGEERKKLEAQITKSEDEKEKAALEKEKMKLELAEQQLEKAELGIAKAIKSTEKKLQSAEKQMEQAEQQMEKDQKQLEIANAQLKEANNSDADTAKLRIGNKKVMIISCDKDKKKEDCEEDDRNKHWAGFELGVAGYSTASHTLSPPSAFDFLELNYAKSTNVNINFWEKDIPIVKEYIKIITGLGLSFNSYSLKKDVTLVPDASVIAATTDSINYQRNKLKTAWVNLPLMLAFNTNKNPKKAFHLSGGVVVGYKIGSKTKQKYNVGEQQYKPKVKSNYNMLPYHYSARVGVGFSNVNLYASYALSSLFETKEGPEMHPFTVGVRLVAF